MEVKSLNRNIIQRLFGTSETKLPKDKSSWSYKDGKVIIDLSKVPELSKHYGAIRLEGKDMPNRLLVIRGNDEFFYAFKNHCTHRQRRLDPVPGTDTVQCCSVGKSTFDFGGLKLTGAAQADIKTYAVTKKDNILTVLVN